MKYICHYYLCLLIFITSIFNHSGDDIWVVEKEWRGGGGGGDGGASESSDIVMFSVIGGDGVDGRNISVFVLVGEVSRINKLV